MSYKKIFKFRESNAKKSNINFKKIKKLLGWRQSFQKF